MGTITSKTKDGKTSFASGRFFVDASGNFLGEYFMQNDGRSIHGCMPLPPGAIEVSIRPDSHRCKWDGKTQKWFDPGPSENELKREADKKASKDARTSAIAKLSALGLTANEIKAIGL